MDPPRSLRQGPLLVLLAVLTAACFALLAWDLEHGGPVTSWEAQHWSSVIEGLPPGFVHGLQAIGLLAKAPALALLATAVLVLMARQGSWRDFYVLLSASAGAAASIVVAQWWTHRTAPLPDGGILPASSFPHEAALFPLLMVGLLRWLRQAGRSEGLAPSLLLLAVAVAAAPVATGAAWPSDLAAGALVVSAWAAAALAIGHLVEPANRQAALLAVQMALPGVTRTPRENPLRFPQVRKVLHSRWFYGGLIALGVALRVATFWTYELGIDAHRYAVMAHSLLAGDGLTLPWGPVYDPGTGPAASRHYPPLYPLLLAGFYKLFGFSAATTHLAAIATSLGALAVVAACTRDLYGPRAAWIVTAFIALNPILVQNTGKGYSENLVLALFTLTLWAILKSLDRPPWIVPAGLLAGLGYLAKSSMGPFFVLAGLAGLAWRLRWHGLRVLRDPWYLGAAALFGTILVAWSLRNMLAYGSWQTSLHVAAAYSHAMGAPVQWLLYAALATVFLAVMGYLVLVGLLPWIPRLSKIPLLHDERDSGLWLALLLPLLLTGLIVSALWMHEGRLFFSNVRYIAFIAVPAAWLLVRHVRPDEPGLHAAAGVCLLLLVSGSVVFALPSEPLASEISHSMRGHVEEGDRVVFVGTRDVYRYHFDLTLDGARQVEVLVMGPEDMARADADWFVVRGGMEPEGYERHKDARFQVGPVSDAMTVWRRA